MSVRAQPWYKPLGQIWRNLAIMLGQLFRVRANPQSSPKYKVALKTCGGSNNVVGTFNSTYNFDRWIESEVFSSSDEELQIHKLVISSSKI